MKKLFILFFVTILITYDSFCQPVPITASIPYNGTEASGTYMVYRAWNVYNIPLSNLRKPLILVEGFDPNGDYGIADIYSMIQDNNFADRLHNLGYDIIILNFGNGGDYIQKNAFLLIELINQINAQKPNNEPLVVAGFSMGGLVARYALTYMEQHSMNHQTKLYVSLDSPHKGAHVPVGIQALALSFDFDLYKSMFPDLQNSLNMFQAPAAKQMLKYRLTSPDQIDGEVPVSSDFTNFFNELNNLNSCSGFPQNCRNIGISLGNWNGRPQRSNIDSDGDGYKDFQQSGLPMFDVNLPKGTGGTQTIWNASTCDIIAAFTFQARVGTMYSDNYPGFSTRSSSYWNLGNYFCATYWYANPNNSALFPLGAYQHLWQYKNKEAMDFAPGSFLPIGNDIVNSMNSQINCSFAYVSNSTFIPTVSSLCYDTDNLFYDIGNDSGKLNKTPFDSIYGLSGENTSHITGLTTDTGLVNWLVDQISENYAKTKGCCPYLPSFSLTVNGPYIVCSSGGTFTVNQAPPNSTVSWNSSSNITLPSDRNVNPIIATPNGNGTGWVQAYVSTTCESVTLPQFPVWAGEFESTAVSGQAAVCPNSLYTYTAQVPGGHSSSYSYSWTYPSGWYNNGQVQNSINLQTPQYNMTYGTVRVAITNQCGTPGYSGTTVYPRGGCPQYFTVFPNPATDNITITIIDNSASNTDTPFVNQNIANADVPTNFTVRIYNSQSTLISSVKRSGMNFSVPLTNMRDGTYIIEVSDGKTSTTQTLIVKHN